MEAPLPFKAGIIGLVILFDGCSSVRTYVPSTAQQNLKEISQVRLLVKTGYPHLDKLVYEMAFLEFQSLLPLSESHEAAGAMEIAFTSSAESAFVGTTSTTSTASMAASGWYDGRGYWDGSGYVSGTSTSIASGSTFTWQNSTMIIVLKGASGKRIWTADYKYKGGWEMSGWVVNTPDEAARLLIKRLAQKFKADFKE